MYRQEMVTLKRIARRLRRMLPGRIASIYAFGSRVRKDHEGWSDFDLLIVVAGKTPEVEHAIVGVVVEEEMRGGFSFTPVIKDSRSFEFEKEHHSPFYQNLAREGKLL